MASFEERIYQLGFEALAEQERQVTEVRGRGSTLFAAGAVIASLLAKPVFHVGHPDGYLEVTAAAVGLLGGGGLLLFVILLLRPYELGFSVSRERHTVRCGTRGHSRSLWSISPSPKPSRNAGATTLEW